MSRSAPGRVLQRSLLAWGLGDLALGRRGAGYTWLAAEAFGVLLVAALTVALVDTTAHLIPFLAGAAFIAVWAGQAIAAHARAQRRQGAIPPPDRRSPSASVIWLSLPILLWGAGYWLIPSPAAAPGAVLDRFVGNWQQIAAGEGPWAERLAERPSRLSAAAGDAVERLEVLCERGEIEGECADDLFRDVRIRIADEREDAATAVAEVVDYQSRPTRVLIFFEGSEIVPVARETLLTLDLRARPADLPFGIDLGAQRWQIATADAG